MTVSTAYAPLNYTGNGSTTVFSVTWQFLTGSLVVTLVSSAGLETVKTISTHYTVSGGTDANGLPATGSVTMLTAPAAGETLRISRATSKLQASTWTNGGSFQAKTLEATVDRLMLIAQEGGGGGVGDGITGDSMQFVSSGADPDYWDAEDSIIRGLADPVGDTDAISKGYGDDNYGGAAAATAVAAAAAAASSATNASNSATSATTAWDDFDDRYLGAKASNPSVDNDGDALETGAVYWNTTTSEMRVYDGATWVDAWSISSYVATVTTRTALKALDPTETTQALLTESGREGLFKAVNSAVPVTDTGEGIYIASDTAGWHWERVCSDHTMEATWFGVVADYSFSTDTGTDNATAAGYAIDMAVALQKELLWPGGAMRLGSLVDRSYATDISFSMRGVSQQGTQFVVRGVENSAGAIRITATNISKILSVRVTDFTIYARGGGLGSGTMNCGVAMEIVRNPVPLLRIVREVFVERVDTIVYNNDSGYFTKGIRIVGCRFPLTRHCRMQNQLGSTIAATRHDDAWEGYLGDVAFDMVDCWGAAMHDCHARAFKTGYSFDSATAAEGGEVINSAAVEIKIGIYKNGATNEPGFVVRGNHINYRDYGIKIDNSILPQIEGVVFYNENASPANDGVTTPADILLTDFEDGVLVHNCVTRWDGQYAAGRSFIRSTSPRTSGFVVAVGNMGEGTTYADTFDMAGTLVRVIEYGNFFNGAVNQISNMGVTELATGRVPVLGGQFAPALVGTATSAATKSPVVCAKVIEHDGPVSLQLLGNSTDLKSIIFGDQAQTRRFEIGASNTAGLRFYSLGTEYFRMDSFGRITIVAGSSPSLLVGSNPVVGARKTGWAVATGTATRTTFDTATVTLPQLAERLKALIDDLHGTAGHGLIGT